MTARDVLKRDARHASGGRAGEMWLMASLLLLEYKDAIERHQSAACPVFHARQAQINGEEDVCTFGK